ARAQPDRLPVDAGIHAAGRHAGPGGTQIDPPVEQQQPRVDRIVRHGQFGGRREDLVTPVVPVVDGRRPAAGRLPVAYRLVPGQRAEAAGRGAPEDVAGGYELGAKGAGARGQWGARRDPGTVDALPRGVRRRGGTGVQALRRPDRLPADQGRRGQRGQQGEADQGEEENDGRPVRPAWGRQRVLPHGLAALLLSSLRPTTLLYR